jgi:succinoglycan biosynthesis protein ExoL
LAGCSEAFGMSPRIAYFVHDLADSAVHRRTRMLVAGGATVQPIGFRRNAEPITAVEGIPAVDLGQTVDGMLLKRAVSVVVALIELEKVGRHIRGSNVILARNLEMLMIAARARKRYAPTARLVYECLDIHRSLLSNHLDGTFLNVLESRLWRNVDLLVTSSPAFIRKYFTPRGFPASVKIVENKILMLEDDGLHFVPEKRPAGPPWRIGWFGMIRCRRSLDVLSSIAHDAGGAVEVIIRGRPSAAIFPDFDKALAGRPHVHYAGPYHNPIDLPAIYGDVHFVWAVDYYEGGQNSAWLLPNRLYEGSAYGAVPIALAGVETGAWLKSHEAGVVLKEPIEEKLIEYFKSLDQGRYEKLARAIDALPRGALISRRTDCRELVEVLCQPCAEPSDAVCRDSAERVALNSKSSGLAAGK